MAINQRVRALVYPRCTRTKLTRCARARWSGRQEDVLIRKDSHILTIVCDKNSLSEETSRGVAGQAVTLQRIKAWQAAPAVRVSREASVQGGRGKGLRTSKVTKEGMMA